MPMFARVWEKTSRVPIKKECYRGQKLAIYRLNGTSGRFCHADAKRAAFSSQAYEIPQLLVQHCDDRTLTEMIDR